MSNNSISTNRGLNNRFKPRLFHSEQAIYPVLLVSIFILASCGILYELLLSSISSYFLGNSIVQFSLTIGLFMFFMGIGSWFSRFIKVNLFENFIIIEILLGFFGGISAPALYYIYASESGYYIYNFIFIGLLGILIGLEVPIVTRIINKYTSLKETVANVLSYDYIGALIASITFPLILLPVYGIMRTALAIGILNLLVAVYNAFLFRKLVKNGKTMATIAVLIIIFFIAGILYAPTYENRIEQKAYQDKIVLTKQSPYQRIVLTRWNKDYRLYINGSIQFSSTDEYRYHEALVHPAMLMAKNHEKILILGGGDGLALKQIFKYKDVQEIHLVDLDPAITDLAKNNEIFIKLNDNNMNDKRVKIFNKDAYKFIEKSSEIYSVIIIDLPDPNDTGLGKLYSREFYTMLRHRLAKDGVWVSQSTSPYFAPKAYWCIYNTMNQVFDHPIPYHVNVPSFGEWGFVMAGHIIDYHCKTNNKKDTIATILSNKLSEQNFKNELKFLNSQNIAKSLIFDKDMQKQNTDINTLNTQKLVTYYIKSADKWR